MSLTDALADALINYGCINPALPIDVVAEGVLRSPDFREALTEAIFVAIRDDMSLPGSGYIDFSWHPALEGYDSWGAQEARGLAEDIVAHMLPEDKP